MALVKAREGCYFVAFLLNTEARRAFSRRVFFRECVLTSDNFEQLCRARRRRMARTTCGGVAMPCWPSAAFTSHLSKQQGKDHETTTTNKAHGTMDLQQWLTQQPHPVRFKNDKFYYSNQTANKDRIDEIWTDALKAGVPHVDLLVFRTLLAQLVTVNKPQHVDDWENKLLCAAMEEENITISLDGLDVKKNEEELTSELARAAFARQTDNYNASVDKDLRVKDTFLYNRYLLHLSDTRHQHLQNLRELLRFRPACGERCDEYFKFTLNAVGSEKPHLDIPMLQHWIWLAKRKIYNLPIEWPFMFVLVSPHQGTGKTTFIEEHLCKPLECRYTMARINALADAREIKKWSNSFVINFDEMAKSMDTYRGAKDISEAVKMLVSGKSTVERIMGSQEQQRFQLRATYCGTSNKNINDTICDPTGMRRFWQINVKPLDWGQICAMRDLPGGWALLWQSVDENRHGGYYDPTTHPLAPEVFKLQNQMTIQPIFAKWFKEHYYVPDYKLFSTAKDAEKMGYVVCKIQTLYDKYKMYCEDMGHHALAVINFEKTLQNFGVRELAVSEKRNRKLYVIQERFDEITENQQETGQSF